MMDEISNNESAFQKFMNEIDAELQNEGTLIHLRPMSGWIKVMAKMDLCMSILPPSNTRPVPGRYDGDHLSVRVNDWFEKRYGEKLKVSFSPGHTIVRIRGDLYKIELPKLFGSAVFTADPQPLGVSSESGSRDFNQVPTANVLSWIKGLTKTTATMLSHDELRYLVDFVVRAIDEFERINSFCSGELGEHITADLRSSIDRLFQTCPSYGGSRWDSLQATEKTLKLSLNEEGIKFPKGHKGHNLIGLRNLSKKEGVRTISDAILLQIQCDSKVRYGETPSSAEQALEAHESARTTCSIIATSWSHLGISYRPSTIRS